MSLIFSVVDDGGDIVTNHSVLFWVTWAIGMLIMLAFLMGFFFDWESQ
jgi:hypothetical protein